MNILIVEDETALASALEHILKKAGRITDVVGDGQSAQDYARGFSYDLLLGSGPVIPFALLYAFTLLTFSQV